MKILCSTRLQLRSLLLTCGLIAPMQALLAGGDGSDHPRYQPRYTHDHHESDIDREHSKKLAEWMREDRSKRDEWRRERDKKLQEWSREREKKRAEFERESRKKSEERAREFHKKLEEQRKKKREFEREWQKRSAEIDREFGAPEEHLRLRENVSHERLQRGNHRDERPLEDISVYDGNDIRFSPQSLERGQESMQTKHRKTQRSSKGKMKNSPASPSTSWKNRSPLERSKPEPKRQPKTVRKLQPERDPIEIVSPTPTKQTMAGENPKKTNQQPPNKKTKAGEQYPLAVPVPGRKNLVYSPGGKNRMISIEGFAAGSLAVDPYTDELFRVP